MFHLTSRLRAAFFVASIACAGMGLAACSTGDGPSETYLQKALYDATKPACGFQKAVLTLAFSEAIDTFIEADGKAFEAAAAPIGRLSAMRAENNDDALMSRLIYGEIALAFAPYIAEFLKDRRETYSAAEASMLLTEIGHRVLTNAASVSFMIARMKMAACPQTGG